MATARARELDAPQSRKTQGLETATELSLRAAPEAPDLDSPELYINRELSLLEFQKRVLEEAQDPANPLLERVKFLAILSSNLDEFFMVRAAGLQKQVASGTQEVGIDGRTASEQLELIRQQVRGLAQDSHLGLRQEILPALEREGIRIPDFASLGAEDEAHLNAYFVQSVFPVLTPLAFDPGRPFPHISNLSLNLAVAVGDRQGAEHFARLKVPDTLAQLVALDPAVRKSSGHAWREGAFVWLEQLIAANLSLLFPGMEILGAYPFRLIRDAEVAIQELESDDLLESVEEALRKRRFTSAVRLQVDSNMPERIVEILTSNIEIDPEDVYRIEGPIGLSRLMQLCGADRPDLKDAPFVPLVPASFGPNLDEDIFAVIRREDVLLHHPFESFQPIVEFLRQAARDPDVLAIKMTLYRVGRNSPIVAALLDAIENGKQVAALVELKARFDEESNIEWARTLEDAGVHVVYGLVGLKVHSKIALVVRREGEVIHRYVHLGTGNYNPVTARLYTDFGFLTSNDEIADDATHFFNALTGYAQRHGSLKLMAAPVNLRPGLKALIQREIELQKKGEPGRLVFKINALEDPQMIKLLYRASQAGVKVDLLIHGLCCLRPGIPGVSENIRVTSIVGRFLEHSRIYWFRNGGAEEVYLGSADLMRRNLDHRVEVVFPVEDPKLARRLKDVLDIYWRDEAKARHLQSDGQYIRSSAAADALNAQLYLLTHHAAQVKRKGPSTPSAKRRLSNGPRRPAKNESPS
ncbi:MAG TPA: polyphosphate kinase 1 [Terriglobales bacterium]